jgi:hypothetical protein
LHLVCAASARALQGASASGFYEQAQRARERASQHRGWQDAGADSSFDEDDVGGNGASTGAGAGEPLTDRDTRRIATLAARAARASRTWRVCQEAAAAARRRSLQITAVSSASSLDDV